MSSITVTGNGSAADGDADVLAEAAVMFGAALPQAKEYAGLLTRVGTERGIVGPAEAARIWDRHLLNCGVIARLLPTACALVDLGSGAGLPGIVLALLRPESQVTLLEPMARRVAFLQECVAQLGLGNVEVVRGRAEELAGKMAVDVVTSRAVAPLEKVALLSAGLARPGGRVLAMKGASAEAELTRARPVLARLGVGDARVITVASASGAITATLVSFTTTTGRSGGSRAAVGRRAVPGQDGARAGQWGGPIGKRKSRPNSRRGGG